MDVEGRTLMPKDSFLFYGKLVSLFWHPPALNELINADHEVSRAFPSPNPKLKVWSLFAMQSCRRVAERAECSDAICSIFMG